MEPEIVHAAGLVIIAKAPAQQVLLMKHKSRWDLPKGHADEGETLIQTALRETDEETGISSNQLTVDKEFEFALEYDVEKKKRGSYRKRTTYFLAWIDQPAKVELTEHIGYKWVDWPVSKSIQPMTIDPLFTAVQQHLDAK